MDRTSVRPPVARSLMAAFLVLVSLPAAIDWIVSARSDQASGSSWSQLAALPRRVRAAVSNEAELKTGSDPFSMALARVVAANRVVLAGLQGFEDSLSDESPVAAVLRPRGQKILSGWLGVGNERVYLGHDGWLFYRPDVE